jgi:hypothetical protein
MPRITLPPAELHLVEDAPRRRLWRFTTEADFETARGAWFLSACTELRSGDVVMFSAGLPGVRHAALGQVGIIQPDGQTVVQIRAFCPIGDGVH